MAENEDRVDAMFHALADRTRRDILRRVLAGEHSVSALAAAYDVSFAAVQKHVAVLERAGLVVKRRVGREALASGDVDAVRSVASMLTELRVDLARPDRPHRRVARARGRRGLGLGCAHPLRPGGLDHLGPGGAYPLGPGGAYPLGPGRPG
ncbi:ArsR/SmtB family transcription factor [Salana multivorans]